MANWFWQKLDIFVGAVFVAVAGIAACQSHAVMVQYTQQLAIEVQDARAHLADVRTGLRYRVMGDTVRGELEQQASARFGTLKRALDSVADANILTRPIAMARNHDSAILSSAWQGFKPAVPLTTGAVIYTFIGMVVGFLVYEAVKLPIMLVARGPRRRFRRRG